MEKLTDVEIIKSLGCHIGKEEPRCSKCAFAIYGCDCLGKLLSALYDLINRQKAENEKIQKAWNEDMQDKIKFIHEQQEEIERLNVELEFKCDDCKNIRLSREEYKKAISQAKSEAYREFADKLIDDINKDISLYGNCTVHSMALKINNTLKELTEGKKE